MGTLFDLDDLITILILLLPVFIGIIINRIRNKKIDDAQVSKYLSNTDVFFSIIIFVSFFLPWLKNSSSNLSGYNLWDLSSNTNQAFLLLLIPIGSVLTIASNFLKYNKNLIARLFGIYTTIYVIYFLTQIIKEDSNEEVSFSIGFLLIYSSGILLFVTSRNAKLTQSEQ